MVLELDLKYVRSSLSSRAEKSASILRWDKAVHSPFQFLYQSAQTQQRCDAHESKSHAPHLARTSLPKLKPRWLYTQDFDWAFIILLFL